MKLRSKSIGFALMAIFGLVLAGMLQSDTTEAATEKIDIGFSFTGLEDLGEDYVYEGWVIDDGSAVSAGRFSVDAEGNADLDSFTAEVSAVANVSTYVLTIEPAEGDDPAPSATHVVAGDFDGNSADLTISHAAALGNDFTAAAGSYILAVPSDTDTIAAYNNGIWWLDPTGDEPVAGLDLPTLPAGWVYEGWIVTEDGPISTGTFTDVAMADSDAGGPDAGPGGTPGYPGQDFVDPALDLIGTTAVISIEPSPDNSPAPFTFKPLVDTVEDTGAPGILQAMSNNIANSTITGTATIDSIEEVIVKWKIKNLEPLGDDFIYEGWLIDNGNPVSTGRFDVTATGTPDFDTFSAYVSAQENVSAFVLTIEPAEGDDPAPAATHVVAGSFEGGIANVNIAHPAALGDDFTSAAGSYILAVPSDTDGVAAYNNGLWFLDPSGDAPVASLDLPTLPEGWAYEGWVVGENGPVSTGTFTDVAAADSDAGGPTAGPGATPAYPGQDFVDPAVDLIGQTVVISIEPVPDNSPAPFTFKPLVDVVEDTGGPGISQDLTNNIANTNIFGTVSIGDREEIAVKWDFNGLEDLGPDFVYEGWIIDNGSAVSSGRFTVDADGVLSSTVFKAAVTDLDNVSTFVLTIEPAVGDDPAPSATHVVAGDFNAGVAQTTIAHGAALGDDFTSAAGSYILAVPSDTNGVAAYNNGIWWLDPSGDAPVAGLDLPTLPAGWVYEGWIVTGDGPVSTGTFTDVAAPDSDAGGPTAGPGATPGYPGQDFVDPAVDLIGTTAVISIEPSPDNSPAPFTFKPLVHVVEDTGGPGISQTMNNNIANSNIDGTVYINDLATIRLELELEGLEDLGEGWVYENWVIDNGEAVSAGRFSVEATRATTTVAFETWVTGIENVTTYVLTIEPAEGDDPAPSATHVVAGDIVDGEAIVNIGHPAALGDDFTDAAGSYILAVPSDTDGVAEYYNGIWWLDPSGDTPVAGLDLPTLPDGWVYEGWIVTADGPVSTGTFTDVAAADSDAGGPAAGPGATPAYPGQDFVDPALNLIGTTAVISIEPSPDNSPAPFTFKPLVHAIEDTGAPGISQSMNNNIENSNISGTVKVAEKNLIFLPFAPNLQ